MADPALEHRLRRPELRIELREGMAGNEKRPILVFPNVIQAECGGVERVATCIGEPSHRVWRGNVVRHREVEPGAHARDRRDGSEMRRMPAPVASVRPGLAT